MCVSSGTNTSLGFPSRRQCCFGGQLFVQPRSPWNVRLSTKAEGDAQGHGETVLGEPGPATAIPRRESPLSVGFVALGGCQFRVRTWLCLVLDRFRAVPYPSDGTGVTAHPVGQLPAVWGLPWVMSILSGALLWPLQAPANRDCQVQVLGEAADAWKM